MQSEHFLFGPHHTALIEPLKIDLDIDGERINYCNITAGFSNREIENSLCLSDYRRGAVTAERICGMCSYFHSTAYCGAIEKLKLVEISERSKYLRLIWSELCRIQNHYFRLALAAGAMGSESLNMMFLKIREDVMTLIKLTTGSRIILNVNRPGGVKSDITPDMKAEMLIRLKRMKKDRDIAEKIVKNDYCIRQRLYGIGLLPKETAVGFDATGVAARASGISTDARCEGQIYSELGFHPIVRTEGDAYARLLLRIMEIGQSVELIRNALARIPEGDIYIPVKGTIKGKAEYSVEQPGGRLVYSIKASGDKNITDIKIQTASDTNFRLLEKVLAGNKLGDIPVILASIGMCVGCLDK